MPKRQPKTAGLEWLIYSLMAFNGSGYADYNSADDYIDSYILYSKVKNRREAVALAMMYRQEIKLTIENLLATTNGAGKQPLEKIVKKMEVERNKLELI